MLIAITVASHEHDDRAAAWVATVDRLAHSLTSAEVEFAHVRSHRQVTHAYFDSLADSHAGARLATFDEGLVTVRPGVTPLVPSWSG